MIVSAADRPALEIARMVVLSTSHLSAETVDMLDEDDRDKLPWGPSFTRPTGWMFYAGEPPHSLPPDNMPPDLTAVLAFARAHDCVWVMLDADGQEIDELPRYEWPAAPGACG